MPDPEYNIEDVVVKEAADLLPEEKTFLEANKQELTTDELTKFGFQVEPIKPSVRNADEPKNDGQDDGKGKDKKETAGDEDDLDENAKFRQQMQSDMQKERDRTQKLQNKMEVDSYIGANPEFKKYKEAIDAHVNDKAYANIPVERIAKMVAADDMMKLGARRERQAQTKVNATHSPGNTARQPAGGGGPNWLTASREDFQAKRAEVMGQTRK